MKKAFLAFLFALPAAAQYTPPAAAAFTYSGSSWIAAATTSTTNPLSYTPPAVALYCQNGSGQWVPADSSCFGGGSGSGTVSAGTAGQFAWYAANGTTVSGNPHFIDASSLLTASEAFIGPSITATFNGLKNVKAPPYNATGDGSTDDTTAIQSAITAAGAGGGIYLPCGNYLISAALSTEAFSGFYIVGAGLGCTTITLKAGDTADAIDINPSSTTYETNPFVLADFTIVGVSGSGDGVSLNYTGAAAIRNVYSTHMGGNGFKLFQTTGVLFSHTQALNNGLQGYALGQQADSTTCLDCGAALNAQWGFYEGAYGTPNRTNNGPTILGGTFDNNGSAGVGGGIYISGDATNGARIDGAYLENNYNQHVQIGTSGDSVGPYEVYIKGYFHTSTAGRAATGISSFSHYGINVQNSFFETSSSIMTKAVWLQGTSASATLTFCGNLLSGVTTAITDPSGAALTSSGNVGCMNTIGSSANNIYSGTTSNTQPQMRFQNVGNTIVSTWLNGALQQGTATPTVTPNYYGLALNDTTGLAAFYQQQGAGTAATPLVRMETDGTGNTSFPLLLVGKGTGNVLAINNASTNIFNVAASGAVQVNNLTASELVATDASKNLVSVTALPSGTTIGVSNAITSATGGSGTGTITCVTAACTNLRGSYTVAGGTFATGTLLTLVWPTTTTAYVCSANVLNDATGASIGYHSVATATGMTISSLTAATGLTVDIDYRCQP